MHKSYRSAISPIAYMVICKDMITHASWETSLHADFWNICNIWCECMFARNRHAYELLSISSPNIGQF